MARHTGVSSWDVAAIWEQIREMELEIGEQMDALKRASPKRLRNRPGGLPEGASANRPEREMARRDQAEAPALAVDIAAGNRAREDRQEANGDAPVSSLSQATVPAQHSTAQSKTVIKLPRYTGRGELESYQNQVRFAASYNGWDETQTATHLALALEGDACQVLLDLDSAEPLTLPALMTALERRFGQRQFLEVSREKLTMRRRIGAESLSVLAADIRLLARRGYPQLDKAGQQELACQTFLQALTPERLQQQVRIAKPASLDAALHEAERLELILGTKPNETQANTPRVRAADDEDSEEVRWVQRNPNRQREQRERRCFRCDEPGHFARDCIAPAPKARAPQPTGNDNGAAQ